MWYSRRNGKGDTGGMAGTRSMPTLLWQNWKTRTAVLFAGTVSVASGVSWLANGASTVSDSIEWLVWIYGRANTPWLGLFVLAITGWLMWDGCRDIRAEIKSSEDRASRRA